MRDLSLLWRWSSSCVLTWPFLGERETERTLKVFTKKRVKDFPSGAVVKNSPANAGNTGLSLGLGRSHMPQSN